MSRAGLWQAKYRHGAGKIGYGTNVKDEMQTYLGIACLHQQWLGIACLQ